MLGGFGFVRPAQFIDFSVRILRLFVDFHYAVSIVVMSRYVAHYSLNSRDDNVLKGHVDHGA